MCQYLPTGEFKFLPAWDLQQILRTRADADQGYFVEVDLHCPAHIHDHLNDYPPAPSKTHPSSLSPFQKEMIQQNLRAAHPKWSDQRIEEEINKTKPNEKLIASLEDKKNYVCHYRLLQKYVELGMEVIFQFYSLEMSYQTKNMKLSYLYTLLIVPLGFGNLMLESKNARPSSPLSKNLNSSHGFDLPKISSSPLKRRVEGGAGTMLLHDF